MGGKKQKRMRAVWVNQDTEKHWSENRVGWKISVGSSLQANRAFLFDCLKSVLLFSIHAFFEGRAHDGNLIWF